jgi:Ni/Co efflux regulator RcnB
MLKTLTIRKTLLATAVVIACASTASAAPASRHGIRASADNGMLELIRDRKADRHRRHGARGNRGWRHHHWQHRHWRHRGPPPGWRRYHHRPRGWRGRGCILFGPVWFCP